MLWLQLSTCNFNFPEHHALHLNENKAKAAAKTFPYELKNFLVSFISTSFERPKGSASESYHSQAWLPHLHQKPVIAEHKIIQVFLPFELMSFFLRIAEASLNIHQIIFGMMLRSFLHLNMCRRWLSRINDDDAMNWRLWARNSLLTAGVSQSSRRRRRCCLLDF